MAINDGAEQASTGLAHFTLYYTRLGVLKWMDDGWSLASLERCIHYDTECLKFPELCSGADATELKWADLANQEIVNKLNADLW